MPCTATTGGCPAKRCSPSPDLVRSITPIGPVSLSLTKYDLKSWPNMYLTFNFGYAIFAPSGHFY